MAGVITGSNGARVPAPAAILAPGAATEGRDAMTRHVTLVGFVSALVLGGALVTWSGSPDGQRHRGGLDPRFLPIMCGQTETRISI